MTHLPLVNVMVNGRQEIGNIERFGDISEESCLDVVVAIDVRGECGTEYYANSCVYHFEFVECFKTAHFGHDHVEDDQMDILAIRGVDIYGLDSTDACGYIVAREGKEAFGQPADRLIIVNNENMLSTGTRIFGIFFGAINHITLSGNRFHNQ